MIPERRNQLKKARIWTTGVGVSIILTLFLFLTSGQSDSANKIVVETLTITPLSTIIIAPTETPKFISVEYQLTTKNDFSSQVIFWYTNGGNGQNKTKNLSNRSPVSESVQVLFGEHLEIVGFLADKEYGELTCKILVNNVLIDQSTSYGNGAGVSCTGKALIEE